MRRFFLLVGAVLVCAIAACGPLTYTVRANQLATGADAVITADVNKDANITTIGIVVENLPPPDRVSPGTAHYVAWQRQSDKTPWNRIGALAYDEDARHAHLEGVTVPEQHFELTVSAEKNASPASPSAAVVLSQRVN